MNFLRNAPIGVKLALAPAFSLICLLVVAATAWWGSQALVGQIRNVGEVSMPRLAAVQDLGSRLSHLQRQLMQTLSWEAIGQKAERIAELDKQILQQLSEFDTQVSQFSQLPDLEASQRSAIEALQKHYKVYSHTAKETLDIKSAGVATAASFVFTLDSAYAEATKQIEILASHEKEAVSSSVADARAQADRSGIVLLITTAAALLSAGALAWLVQRQILPPLQRAAAMARTVAGGDLSQASQVDSTDATGQVLSAMNDMRLQLVQLIGRVRQSADSIATASAEIAGGNADLSHRTEQQAAALEETAASMQEMTESLHRNAETARQANQLASSALSVADRGGQVVGQVVQTMQD
ncbi:methyl-accepting chemotaxis protein, partial [Ideonella sp.]|uniref:methyl-accepting chemotaxis protein n=1 Tax=Ideonella sp. TaxID=1929293 RepID=UPI003BB496CD